MNRKFLKGFFVVILFLVGAGIITGAGYYKKSIPKESVTFHISLPSAPQGEEIKPLCFDIRNEGIPKRLLQPGRINISTGHGAGIQNTGEEPIWVKVRVEGIIGNTRITSSSPGFNEKTGMFQKPMMPGKSLNLSVLLDLPRSELGRQRDISSGKIILTDYKADKLLAEIPLSVINSQYH